MSKILNLDSKPWAFRVNIIVKVSLFICFFIALFFDLEVLEGKAMELRAPFFLATAFIIPVASKLKGWKVYPHLADMFIVLPFLLDTLGNLFYLFDSLWYFDDVIHLVNWIFLVLAFHAFRFRKVLDTRDAILLGIGFGAIMIVGWELMEWLISVDGLGSAGGLSLTYGDTVGDLFMSTIGGVIGSILGVRYLGNKID